MSCFYNKYSHAGDLVARELYLDIIGTGSLNRKNLMEKLFKWMGLQSLLIDAIGFESEFPLLFSKGPSSYLGRQNRPKSSRYISVPMLERLGVFVIPPSNRHLAPSFFPSMLNDTSSPLPFLFPPL